MMYTDITQTNIRLIIFDSVFFQVSVTQSYYLFR